MAEKLSTRQRQLRDAEQQAQARTDHGEAAKDLKVPGPGQFPGEATDEPTSPVDVEVRVLPARDEDTSADSDAAEGRKATPHGDTEPRK